MIFKLELISKNILDKKFKLNFYYHNKNLNIFIDNLFFKSIQIKILNICSLKTYKI